MKISVKLSKKNTAINDLLKKPNKLNKQIKDWGKISGCDVYYGTSFAGEPSWKSFLTSGSDKAIDKMNNQGAAAIVFLPIDNRFMIFSFGYGGHQLSGLGIERDFGLKVVLNTVNPESIRSVDTKTHDTVVKVQRTQLSKEMKITDFGFEINKDLLKQIAGRPTNKSFASSINGGESLMMTSDLQVSTIESKAKEIYDAYLSKNYKTNYAWVDNIQSVKDPITISQLDQELEKAINDLLNGIDRDLQIACPEIVDFNAIEYYQIHGYRSKEKFDFIDLDGLIKDLSKHSITSLSLKKLFALQVNAKIENTISHHSWRLYSWIVFSPILNGKQYVLSEGDWFEVSKEYNSHINDHFNSILKNSDEYVQLPLTTQLTETAYIENYPLNKLTEIILDRKLTYIYGGNNRVEICDIYNSSKEFIHIKHGTQSSKLSHLFNQGFVSASLFLSDPKYRKDLQKKLSSNKTLQRTIGKTIDSSEYTVIYRILQKSRVFSIPFFSKIVLSEMHKKIKEMGYKFRLEWVPQ